MKKITFLVLIFSLFLTISSIAQPQPPTNLKAVIETWFQLTFVKLTWDASSIYHGSYLVYKKEGTKNSEGNFKKILLRVHNNSYMDKLISPGKTYSYFVTAFNHNEESGHSDTVEISLSNSSGSAYFYGKLTDESTGLTLSKGNVEFIPILGWHYKDVKVDSFGNYSCRVNPGKYFAAFLARGYVAEFYDNANSILEATEININENDSLKIDVALKPIVMPKKYTLSGKVTDTAGVPVKTDISVLSLNHHFFMRNFQRARTDSNGNYTVTVRENDTVIVFAFPLSRKYLSEFYNNKKEFAEADKIYINGDLTDINFILETKPVYNNSISGKVTNDSGKTLMANVTLFKLKERHHADFKKTTMTDSLGNYTFTNIKPGIYILFTIPEKGYLPTFFKYDGSQTRKWKEADSIEVTETSQLIGIDFIVNPIPDSGFGRITGIIKDNNGTGVNGAIVYAVDENDNVVCYTTADENGEYTISNLLPGTYSVITDKFSFDSSVKNSITIDYANFPSQNVSFTLTTLYPTNVKENKLQVTEYKLSQNYPNPFNPNTIINFQIVEAGWVTLKVYNIIGQEITTLINEIKPVGSYSVKFDASKIESGIYFYKLNAGKTVLTRKMVLIK